MPTVAAKGGPSSGCEIVSGHDGAHLFLARYGRERRQRPAATVRDIIEVQVGADAGSP